MSAPDTPSARLTAPRVWAYAAGAFATQVMVATLGAYLPSMLLHRAGAGPFAIGWTLAIIPLFGLVLQPAINAASDRLRSPWGRRRPFLAAGAILGGLGLAALPDAPGLPAAVGCMLVVALGYVCVDGPYRASMSEAWPGAETLVSTAQAALKGLGTLLAFGLVAWLGEKAFLAAGAVWALGVGSTFFATPRGASPERLPPAAPAHLALGAHKRFTAGLFLAWLGLQGVTAFVVSFIVHDLAGVAELGSAAGQAAVRQAMGLLVAFTLTAMALAVPAGRLAQRYGASRILAAGLLVLSAGYGLALASNAPWHAFAFALLGGVGFAALQVLPYPVLLESVEPGREGRLASLYTVTIDVAQLASMVACGWLIAQAHSYRVVFVLALAATLGAAGLFGARRAAPAPSGAAA